MIDPSYWTLGIECIFYALVAILMAVGRWQPLAVARLLMLASGGFWLIMFANQFAGMVERDRFEELLLLRHGCLFALGILIQLRHQDRPDLSLLWIAPALFASLLCVLHSALTAAKQGIDSRALVAMALFLGGVAVIAFAPVMQPNLTRWRLRRAAVWLGLATYPLYLLHLYVGLALIGDLARGGVDSGVAVLLVMALMVAAALVIANGCEPPIRAMLNRWRSPARGLRRDNRRFAFPRAG